MIPIKLDIEGIQSFKERQTVDFEKLSSCGIFGIFGKTGSGKSTILDCIMIALYGEGGKNRDQKDFINLSCAKAGIRFVFETAENGGKARYIAERNFRIRKGGTMDNSAFLYREEKEGLLCVAEKINDVDEALLQIVGLTAEEFKKCVILPQGEFASFIKAQRGERLKIIGSLFNLEQYGDRLFEKVSSRYYACDSELKGINTAIETIGDFDYGEIGFLTGKIEKEIEETEKSERQKKELNDKIKEADCVISDIAKRDLLIKEKKELDGIANGIGLLREKTESCKKAETLLPLISDAGKLKKDLLLYANQISEAENNRLSLSKRMETLEKNKEFAENGLAEKGMQAIKAAGILNSLKPDALILADKTAQKNKLAGQYAALKEKEADNVRKREKLADETAKTQKGIDLLESGTDVEKLLKQNFLNGCLFEIDGAITYLGGSYKEAVPHFETKRRQREKELENTGMLKSGESYLQDINNIKILKETKQRQEESLNALIKEGGETALEILKVTENGMSLKQDIAAIKEKFGSAGITGEISLSLIEKEVKRLNAMYDTLKDNRDNAEKEYNLCKDKINTALSDISKFTALCESAQETLTEKQTRLNSGIKQCGFLSAEEVLNSALSPEELNEAEKRIKKYDADIAVNKKNTETLEEKLKDLSINKELYGEMKKNLEITEKRLSELTKNVAIDKQNLKLLNEKKEKLSALKQKREKTQTLFDNLSKLYSLVKGKNFMEYAAEEYINGITLSACGHISRLTGGRYALVYKNGGFYVSDNYSGGEIRTVNTLSGGETFLVSLSLAVALSEAIVKMSDKPVEFFFLDEGFGTLDRELCDTVINTLEKLRRSHFTIGLISHVPELMQRLTCKLTVSAPDVNNGSRVSLSM